LAQPFRGAVHFVLVGFPFGSGGSPQQIVGIGIDLSSPSKPVQLCRQFPFVFIAQMIAAGQDRGHEVGRDRLHGPRYRRGPRGVQVPLEGRQNPARLVLGISGDHETSPGHVHIGDRTPNPACHGLGLILVQVLGRQDRYLAPVR
jgi:hypothetical protein